MKGRAKGGDGSKKRRRLAKVPKQALAQVGSKQRFGGQLNLLRHGWVAARLFERMVYTGLPVNPRQPGSDQANL